MRAVTGAAAYWWEIFHSTDYPDCCYWIAGNTTRDYKTEKRGCGPLFFSSTFLFLAVSNSFVLMCLFVCVLTVALIPNAMPFVRFSLQHNEPQAWQAQAVWGACFQKGPGFHCLFSLQPCVCTESKHEIHIYFTSAFHTACRQLHIFSVSVF